MVAHALRIVLHLGVRTTSDLALCAIALRCRRLWLIVLLLLVLLTLLLGWSSFGAILPLTSIPLVLLLRLCFDLLIKLVVQFKLGFVII